MLRLFVCCHSGYALSLRLFVRSFLLPALLALRDDLVELCLGERLFSGLFRFVFRLRFGRRYVRITSGGLSAALLLCGLGCLFVCHSYLRL